MLTGAACKLAGGQWRGGYDVSGHVFLLTLGSAFLGMEILPVVLRYAGLGEARVVMGPEGQVRKAGGAVVIGTDDEEQGEGRVGRGVGGAVFVAGLSWWMLLMTAAYFHTWVEKVRVFRRLDSLLPKLLQLTLDITVHRPPCCLHRRRRRLFPPPRDSRAERRHWNAGGLVQSARWKFSRYRRTLRERWSGENSGT